MRMVRAVTAADVYAHPRAEFARPMNLGLLRWVVTGFWLAVPDDQVGTGWLPGLEAAQPVSRLRPTVPTMPS